MHKIHGPCLNTEDGESIVNLISVHNVEVIEFAHHHPKPPTPHGRVEIWLNGNKCAEFSKHESIDNMENVARAIGAYLVATRRAEPCPSTQ